MENTKKTDEAPEEVIVNELRAWLLRLNLASQPTKVAIEISQNIQPQTDTLNRVFNITVSRNLERVVEAEPVEIIENTD